MWVKVRHLAEYKVSGPVDLFFNYEEIFRVVLDDLVNSELLKRREAYCWSESLDLGDEVYIFL